MFLKTFSHSNDLPFYPKPGAQIPLNSNLKNSVKGFFAVREIAGHSEVLPPPCERVYQIESNIKYIEFQ